MKQMTERSASDLGAHCDRSCARASKKLGLDRKEVMKDPLTAIALARAELEQER